MLGISCESLIYLRYYFHYWVVVAALTDVPAAVESVGNFGTYNDSILVVMGVSIVYVAVVIVAVFVVVNRSNFFQTFLLFSQFNLFFSPTFF